MSESPNATETRTSPSRPTLIALSLLSVAMLGGVYFLIAGRIDLPLVWAYLSFYGCLAVWTGARIDPDLIQERTKPGPGGQDMLGVWVMKILGLVHFAVAALDARFRYSTTVPPTAQIAGLVAFVLGFTLVTKCMIANRYFSSVIRLQTDRGHQLITGGPYRWVRHPGYAGAILGLVGSPLALNSWLSGIPAIFFVAVLIRRTVLEDRYLLANMPGYDAFAARVRRCVIPGIW